jgi:formylglycine-generating enzyme required for sulfatase activity
MEKKRPKHDMSGGMSVLKVEPGGKDYNLKEDPGASWEAPGFVQTDEHPVVGVSWEDAQAFCKWLSEQEGVTCRLPSDEEWSMAVGLDKEPGTTPEEKDGKTPGYPWGTSETPPDGAGNYAGEESAAGMPANWTVLTGYRDKAARTDVVGNYTPNRFGIYDLGGNVWEWCGDTYSATISARVLRGASWIGGGRVNLLSSRRSLGLPGGRYVNNGFRCVVSVPVLSR